MAQRINAQGAKRRVLTATAEPAARLIMGYILASARLTGGISPFGAAFAASSGGGMSGMAALVGAAVGYLAAGSTLVAIKYIAIMALIRSCFFVLEGTAVSERALFPILVTLIAALGVGFVYTYDGVWGVVPTVYYVVESFLMAGCVFFYAVAMSPWEQTQEGNLGRVSHSVASLVLLGSLLAGVSRVTLFGVLSVGRMLAVIVVLLFTYKGGIGAGCTFGAALGAAMDLASGTSGVFVTAYVLAAILAGLFSRNGKLIFALAYTAANAVATIWTWALNPQADALYEAFAATVIFMLLPASAMSRLGALFPVRATGYGFLRAREYTRERIELMSTAFRSLAPAAQKGQAADSAENPAVIFDRASAAVCADCPEMVRCWQRDYSDTFDIMNNITPRLTRYGFVEAGDLPARFADRCVRLVRLIGEINSEARALKLRREYRLRLIDTQRTAFGQYGGVAALLSGVSAELGGGVSVDMALERRLSKYLTGLNISASSAVFRVRGGRLRAEISGEGASALRREKGWLEKLSEVMEMRLCTVGEDGGRIILLEAEPISITVGAAGAKKNGSRMSGDRSVSFRTDEGVFYVILSDGMGSGEGAYSLATSAAGALENFLRAGVAPELALGFVESSMFIRNDFETGCAAIDLMSVDMFTGETRIYKYGAAPSYLKKDGVVKRITSSALPAGLSRPSDRHAGAVRAKLPCGAFAVIISDGVISGTDDRWLRELICGFDGTDPVKLAREILERARQETGASDDMTVLAVRADARG